MRARSTAPRPSRLTRVTPGRFSNSAKGWAWSTALSRKVPTISTAADAAAWASRRIARTVERSAAWRSSSRTRTGARRDRRPTSSAMAAKNASRSPPAVERGGRSRPRASLRTAYGSPPSGGQLPTMTIPPVASASNASSAASLVLPTPASPAISTTAPRPRVARSHMPRSCVSSGHRPARGAAAGARRWSASGNVRAIPSPIDRLVPGLEGKSVHDASHVEVVEDGRPVAQGHEGLGQGPRLLQVVVLHRRFVRRELHHRHVAVRAVAVDAHAGRGDSPAAFGVLVVLDDQGIHLVPPRRRVLDDLDEGHAAPLLRRVAGRY